MTSLLKVSRLLLVMICLLVLSSFAEAGIFKRIHDRRHPGQGCSGSTGTTGCSFGCRGGR